MPNSKEEPNVPEISICKITELLQHNKMDDLALSEERIREETRHDVTLKQVLQLIKTDWYDCTQADLKPFLRKRNELSIENKIIMWQGRVVVPSKLRLTVLRYLHIGHPGTSAMRALARFYVWWPTLEEDIVNFVKKCQENRPNNPELPVYSWSIPEKVWERVHVDFAGPFEGKYWLVLADALSKWIEIKPMSNITTKTLCKKLDGIFTTFGLPQIIVSDNGPQFTSKDFRAYCKTQGIVHITSSPYHPRTNGLAERLVRTFKTRMAASESDRVDPKQKLQNFLFSYRNTPHTTTGKSPAQMMFGRQLNCLLDNVRPNMRRTLRYKNVQANIESEQKTPNFQNGETVFIRTKLENKWKPAVIQERKHRYSYVVRTPEGVLKRRHADHIRPQRSVAQSPINNRNIEREPSASPGSSTSTPHELIPHASSTPISQPVIEAAFSSPLTLEQTPVLRRSKRTVRPPHRLIEQMT